MRIFFIIRTRRRKKLNALFVHQVHRIDMMSTYNFRVHVIYYKSGIWVYPVMDVLTLPLRIVFFAVLLTFCVILYFVGETLNNIIWGNEYTKHKKSHAKSK